MVLVHRATPLDAEQGAATDSAGAARPRVAILGSRGVPARLGGVEQLVEELGSRLVRAGVDVTVFCADGGDVEQLDAYRGMRLEYLPVRGPHAARALLYHARSLWHARRGYDVVYMVGYGASLFCFLPRMSGSEVWINMGGLEWQRPKWGRFARLWWKAMEGVACRVATRLVFDNAAVADEVTARRNPRAAVSVLEHGALVPPELDPAPLQRYDLQPGGYYLIVCRFEPENHLLEMIRGYCRTWSERPLVIVANTDVATSYAQQTLSHKSDRVHFLGPIYDPDVLLPIRQHCFAYLHGHSLGGTNPSLLAAMGCGNATLANDNPFNRETLGDAGLYFDGFAQFKARIQELEELDDDERLALGTQARLRVARHYTWDRVVRGYVDLIANAATARADPQREH